LRVLVSAALRAIGDALESDDPAARTAAAFELLKRVPLSIASRGPRHADEVVYGETARRLAATPIDDQFVSSFDRTAPPPMTKRFAATEADLYALAEGPTDAPPGAVADVDTQGKRAGAMLPASGRSRAG
jgi:hypothetical protein